MSAQPHYSFQQAQQDHDYWGRLVESAVDAHLINSITHQHSQLLYWRDKNQEVDFVLEHNNQLVAIAVKSGAEKTSLSGLQAFDETFHPNKLWQIGNHGKKLDHFLLHDPIDLL